MKKPKAKVGALSVAAEGKVASSLKKSIFSGAIKKKKATSSWKRPGSSKPAAAAVPSTTDEAEDESSTEPLKKKKKSKTKESEPTPWKMAPLDLHPSRSEDVSIS